jgi:molybdopterin-guanine dinucleotide biosynthesis protein A
VRRGALVLAGGRSTRMGRDKATLTFDGRTLLEHVLARLAPLVDEALVVARPDQPLPTLPASVRLAHDEVLDQGPLGGLAAGLAAATSEALYVTSCDVPFLRPGVVRLLFERLGEADVAVAEAEGRLHPLAAVYRRSVLPQVRALLAEGRLRPVFLYERVPTVRVPEADLRAVDPELATLANLNTPEDLTAARAFSRVRLELFEGARLRAGVGALDVPARTLGEALDELARRCPGVVPDVVVGGALAPHWRASLNGRAIVTDPATPLADGDAVLLFSALVGG